MADKLLLAGICIVLLFLGGCTGGGFSNQETVEDYRRGTSGLDMTFITGLPQKELLSDAMFSVGLELHNDGASDIKNGRLLLSYDDEYIGFFSDTNTNFELEGKNQFNPEGEERAIFFEGKTNFLDRESFRRDVTISATACYQYKTIFADLVCLDRPYSKDLETGNPVCVAKDLSSSGQGAPVAVSSVDVTFIENNLGVKPFFDITISHKGKGLVTHSDTYSSQCSSASSVGSLNKVLVSSATLSEIGLDCTDREVILRDGSARLRCTTFSEIVPQRLPFEAPLQIELLYGYAQTESVSTTIVR